MIPKFTLHGSTQQRVSEALDTGMDNHAARIRNAAPTSAQTRSQICQRLGLSDLQSSDAVIFEALDNTLAAAKAKRVQVDPVDALYAAAWGDSDSTPTPIASTTDAMLYALAFGEPMGA